MRLRPEERADRVVEGERAVLHAAHAEQHGADDAEAVHEPYADDERRVPPAEHLVESLRVLRDIGKAPEHGRAVIAAQEKIELVADESR